MLDYAQSQDAVSHQISGLLEAGAAPAVAAKQLYAVLAQLAVDGVALDLGQNTADSDV